MLTTIEYIHPGVYKTENFSLNKSCGFTNLLPSLKKRARDTMWASLITVPGSTLKGCNIIEIAFTKLALRKQPNQANAKPSYNFSLLSQAQNTKIF